MGTLLFELKLEYGHLRFYPACPASSVIATIAKRKTLEKEHLLCLYDADFEIKVLLAGAEIRDWRDFSNGGSK